jgi:hypothetical protein
MDARRAQDLLRHIMQDKDYGASMMEKISAEESIYVLTQILPDCINKAEELGKDNDSGYFSKMMETYRPIVLEKLKKAEHLWVVYCETTGYPYLVDNDMLVLFDYAHHDVVETGLTAAGFAVAFQKVDALQFKNEVAHMYRNGYRGIRFLDGTREPFHVDREDLYDFDEFFKEDYMTNPGLESTMIEFFQEFRKSTPAAGREAILKKREDAMIEAMLNAEYMVPCVNIEAEDEVEVQIPFIDLTDKLNDKKQGEQVIAIPAFTDGFEMDKCYEGHHQNMLYKFEELKELVEEMGAAGVLLNALGISYFMDLELMKKMK